MINMLALPGKFRVLLLIAALGCGLSVRLHADPADAAQVTPAEDAARQWLAEIDADKVEKSYDDGCLALRNKVSKQQWITVLQALRPSIGKATARTVQNANYKPDGFEGLQGECVVIKYATNFSVLGPALEIVVLKREDGAWRGAGYNVQPEYQPPAQQNQNPTSVSDQSIPAQPAPAQ